MTQLFISKVIADDTHAKNSSMLLDFSKLNVKEFSIKNSKKEQREILILGYTK